MSKRSEEFSTALEAFKRVPFTEKQELLGECIRDIAISFAEGLLKVWREDLVKHNIPNENNV